MILCVCVCLQPCIVYVLYNNTRLNPKSSAHKLPIVYYILRVCMHASNICIRSKLVCIACFQAYIYTYKHACFQACTCICIISKLVTLD